MKLELLDYGLRKVGSPITWVGFAKCGPSYNPDKFYKTDYGVIVGYEEFRMGDKNFNIT
jgi:hypothetical protein